MSIRIVSDSSSDVYRIEGADYATVPLKIMFGGQEYVDAPGVDTADMMERLQTEKGPSTTSCPNAHDWLSAFEGATHIFALTISSGLSASYEACCLAKQQFESEYPGCRVHVFDSKATGPVLHLLINRLAEGIRRGDDYDTILSDAVEYQERLRILYALQSLTNLARNGRVNATIARLAGVLNIRVIGHASSEGKVDILHKTRGDKGAFKAMVREMQESGFKGGQVIIDHCLNPEGAQRLSDLVRKQFPGADVVIEACGALCSYYADKGGLILGYAVD